MKLPNLKRARELRGMTQTALYLLTYIGRSHISNIESGRSETTPGTARKLADALGYRVDQLANVDEKVLYVLKPKRTKKKEKAVVKDDTDGITADSGTDGEGTDNGNSGGGQDVERGSESKFEW